jgi:hypothetical protein
MREVLSICLHYFAFTFCKFCLDNFKERLFLLATSFYHPLINPIVNPAYILPVSGIPRLVIANGEVVAA